MFPNQAPTQEVSTRTAALGGAVGIAALLAVFQTVGGGVGGPLLVGSMGASAVLLFAVPSGPLSSYWALLGSHAISAPIGVLCAQTFHGLPLAGGLAVGLAIAAMRILRCLHPPGGATALAAVLGGDGVRQMGFDFVLTPVLANAATLLVVAFAFHRAVAASNKLASTMRLRRARGLSAAGAQQQG